MNGPELIHAMERAGMTPQALADYLGVSVHAVTGWRAGRRMPCCRFMERAIREELQRAADARPAGDGRSGDDRAGSPAPPTQGRKPSADAP